MRSPDSSPETSQVMQQEDSEVEDNPTTRQRNISGSEIELKRPSGRSRPSEMVGSFTVVADEENHTE